MAITRLVSAALRAVQPELNPDDGNPTAKVTTITNTYKPYPPLKFKAGPIVT